MSSIRGRLSGPYGTVRTRRIEAGLTQEQLAEMSGLSVRTISDIECGRTTRPRHSSVALLEAALSQMHPGCGRPPGDRSPSPDGPEPALSPATPRQLPQTARGFVGRTRELKALAGLLPGRESAGGTGVIAVITGTAGVGKTALALRWSHEAAGWFPDGQLFADLRGYDPDGPVPAADVLAGFLGALGVTGRNIPPGTAERAGLYRSLLAGRRMLVLLDNAGEAEQVRPLLPGSPTCLTVVTGRDALAGLVARDGAARVDLDLLPPADATGLLQALIGARAHADPGATGTLAAQCSRLPLALRVAAELAATRPAVALADLVRELADEQWRLDLLDAGGDRRTGVSAVFSWSYRLLDPDAARTFRLLALHPGLDLDRSAVAALTGTTVERAGHVLDLLARAHLTLMSQPGRTGLHDLLRGYARRLAVAEDTEEERRAALTRLFDHYLQTAAAAMDALYPAERHRRPAVAAPSCPVVLMTGPDDARAWLDAERASLVAAVAHMAAGSWPGHAIRLAATVFRYLEVGGHYPEIRVIQERARAAAREAGDRAGEAEALHHLSEVDLHQGRYEQATEQMRQALELCRQAGDPTGQGRALASLGIAGLQQGDYRAAAANLRRALALYRQVGDVFGEARAMNNLGLIDLRQGRYTQADGRLQRALVLHRQVGDQANETNCLANMALVLLRRGQYQQAADHLGQALALSRQVGKPVSEAYCLANLGVVDLRLGRHRQAASHLRQALVLSRQLGERSSEAEARNGLGEVLLAVGRPGRARAQHAAALGLARQIGEIYEQANAHHGLGNAYDATGESSEALQHWQAALALYERLGRPEAGQVRAQLARLGLSTAVPFHPGTG